MPLPGPAVRPSNVSPLPGSSPSTVCRAVYVFPGTVSPACVPPRAPLFSPPVSPTLQHHCPPCLSLSPSLPSAPAIYLLSLALPRALLPISFPAPPVLPVSPPERHYFPRLSLAYSSTLQHHCPPCLCISPDLPSAPAMYPLSLVLPRAPSAVLPMPFPARSVLPVSLPSATVLLACLSYSSTSLPALPGSCPLTVSP